MGGKTEKPASVGAVPRPIKEPKEAGSRASRDGKPGAVETPVAGLEKSMPKLGDLTRLKDDFNNLEVNIIGEIKSKEPGKNLAEVISAVEKNISGDQVLAVIIKELGLVDAGGGDHHVARNNFLQNFGKIQEQYVKSLGGIKDGFTAYQNTVSAVSRASKYQELLGIIGGQGRISGQVLNAAEESGDDGYRVYLEGKFEEALKDPENFIADEAAYLEFIRLQGVSREAARMDEFSSMDDELIKRNFDETISRLNGFEEIIFNLEIERVGVGNRAVIEHALKADNILLALKNAADKSFEKDPLVYKKIAPFLKDTMDFIANTDKDLGSLKGNEKRRARILKLDEQIITQFGYIQGLEMEDLLGLQFASVDVAFQSGQELEMEGAQKEFKDKINALRNDPYNGCVSYFFKNKQLLSFDEYQSDDGLPRNKSIKAVEITLAYRKLFDLFRDNEELAENYCGSKNIYNELYDILNQEFKGKEEEIKDIVYPYFMMVQSGKIYISDTAYNLEGDGVQEATFVRLDSKSDGGVIELDKVTGIFYYVIEDSGTIEKHPLIPVKDVDDARTLISKYGEKKTTFFQDLKSTFQAISGVFQSATGVVTDYDMFADNLTRVSTTSTSDRVARAEAGDRIRLALEKLSQLRLELLELERQMASARDETSKSRLETLIAQKRREIETQQQIVGDLSQSKGGGGGGMGMGSFPSSSGGDPFSSHGGSDGHGSSSKNGGSGEKYDLEKTPMP